MVSSLTPDALYSHIYHLLTNGFQACPLLTNLKPSGKFLLMSMPIQSPGGDGFLFFRHILSPFHVYWETKHSATQIMTRIMFGRDLEGSKTFREFTLHVQVQRFSGWAAQVKFTQVSFWIAKNANSLSSTNNLAVEHIINFGPSRFYRSLWACYVLCLCCAILYTPSSCVTHHIAVRVHEGHQNKLQMVHEEGDLVLHAIVAYKVVSYVHASSTRYPLPWNRIAVK